MSHFRFTASLLTVPVLVIALAMVGCSSSDTKAPPSGGKRGASDKKGEGTSTGTAAAKTPLKATDFATIKGKITFNGTPPPPADIRIPDENENKEYCLKGPHTDPTWIVGSDKGVKNVFLWVRAPAGKYFEIPEDKRTPAQPVVKIDQPFCAYEPHAAVVFPSFFDGKTQQKTGQKFEVVNSATITHNTGWSPSNTLYDSAANVIIPPKAPPTEIPVFDNDVAKKRAGVEELFTLKCNIHQWMTGYVWAFDHPYVAITQEDGTYEIKNVPAGSELQLVGWHEAGEYFLPGGAKGERIGPLNANETKEFDFKIGKK